MSVGAIFSVPLHELQNISLTAAPYLPSRATAPLKSQAGEGEGKQGAELDWLALIVGPAPCMFLPHLQTVVV